MGSTVAFMFIAPSVLIFGLLTVVLLKKLSISNSIFTSLCGFCVGFVEAVCLNAFTSNSSTSFELALFFGIFGSFSAWIFHHTYRLIHRRFNKTKQV
jgi:chromate transport protein ChrA